MDDAGSNDRILREILCDILEIDPDELTEAADFVEAYDADSLRAVEILASLERRFKIRIPESELPEMTNLGKVKDVLRRHGWVDGA